MTKVIELPFNFKYRDYQKPLRKFIQWGWKRAVCVWHRRAWKDKTQFNIIVEEAIKHKWGYAYVLPTYTQGKKIIWDSIDNDGYKFRDHIPKELLIWENTTELKFNLANGSFIQVIWSENIDWMRWTNWKWIVFSEFDFQNPMAWEVIRPILAQNNWWAIFNSTPDWKKHLYKIYNMAKENTSWFSQLLTIKDTWVISEEYIQEERNSWMSEQMIQQEYYCSFDVWSIWSYYIQNINQAYEEERIIKLPFNPDIPIDLYFDLWVSDSFTISFKQNDWMFFNFINYYEDNWKSLEFYFSYIDDFIARKNAKLWTLYIPHDWNHKWQAYLVKWLTIVDMFKDKYWSHKVKLIPNTLKVDEWIQLVRKIFPKLRFDKDTCSQFIRCIENYKKEWDDIKKTFKSNPRHDWASHWADNLRYFAVANELFNKKEILNIPKKPKSIYNPMTWKYIYNFK